jgi:predicted permease
MPLFSRAASLYRTLFRRGRLDRELDDELASAVDELTDKHVRAGMEPDVARRTALAELGGLEQVKEDVRGGRIGSGLESILSDLRYAWRGIWRSPGFAAVAILTLALGIGANTAIFTVVNATLIEPLPFRQADRLVFVWTDRSEAGDSRMPMSGPELNDLRERTSLFTAFGAIWSTTTALTGEGDPEQLRIGLVTTNFFNVLGVNAGLGRTFETGDDAQGPPTSILLSWSLWQRRYGGDPGIVGRRILVNGLPTTVVGVMPERFRLLMPPDSAVPDDLQAWQPFNRNFLRGLRGQQYLRIVGRMRDGVSIAEAQREISDVASQISREFPDYGAAGRSFTVVGLQSDSVRDVRPALFALLGAVAILLLIACVNVASLLVARAAARTKETALRVALGAGRGRIFRQCIAEGLVLSVLGAVAGLIAGRGVLALLLSLRPDSLARIEGARIDLPVLAFTTATAVIWGLIFSLAPLSEVFRTDLKGSLQQEGRRSGGTVHYRTRAALVIVQMALGVVLVVGAALMVRTFLQLRLIDPGFRSDGILTFRVTVPGSRYRTQEALNEFSQRLQLELGRLPGVTSVGAISHLPYDTLPNWSTGYLAEVGAEASLARRADARAITPDFFETVGAHLVDGRSFTWDDDQTREPVVIVDESLAQRGWGGQSPVGKPIVVDPYVTGKPSMSATVAGVVRHLRHRSLIEEVREQVYFPVRQITRNPMAYAIRTSTDPAALAGPIRQLIARLDPELPIFDVRPLDSYIVGARATKQFTMFLASVFALAALVLACVGVYGVMAYSVTRRRHEFGVRLALGARPSEVVRLVLREGARLALAGLALGLTGAALATRLIESQLFGVTAADPISYLVAVPVLALAAIAACWLPAVRATAANPLDALRAE